MQARAIVPHLPLLAILVVAAALRLPNLWNDVPPLFADEYEQYVSVQSIATTGHDIDGRLAPFLYTRIGLNPPIYGIAGYLSTLVLGNDPLGWRFPAVLFGLASILALYLLVRELTGRREIALIAAFLLAIEPSAIHFSRIGWEPATVLPFVLGGLWLLLVALREPDQLLPLGPLAGAAVLLGLTPYTYPSAPLYALLLGGALLVAERKAFGLAENRYRLLAAVALAVAVASPAIWLLATDPHATGRAARSNTFATGVNTQTLRIFLRNYVSHFDWRYLFTWGSFYPRYLSGYGVLYWWYGPLAVAGLWRAWRYARSRDLAAWLWFWLAIYPLGAALTDDGFAHPPRAMGGSAIFCMLAAIGAYAALAEVERRLPAGFWRQAYRASALACLVLGAGLSLWSFYRYYLGSYPQQSANDWESGARETFAAVRAREGTVGNVCLVGFNWFHDESYVRYFMPGTHLHISDDPSGADCYTHGSLLVTTEPEPQPGFRSIQIIRGLDGGQFAQLETYAE